MLIPMWEDRRSGIARISKGDSIDFSNVISLKEEFVHKNYISTNSYVNIPNISHLYIGVLVDCLTRYEVSGRDFSVFSQAIYGAGAVGIPVGYIKDLYRILKENKNKSLIDSFEACAALSYLNMYSSVLINSQCFVYPISYSYGESNKKRVEYDYLKTEVLSNLNMLSVIVENRVFVNTIMELVDRTVNHVRVGLREQGYSFATSVAGEIDYIYSGNLCDLKVKQSDILYDNEIIQLVLYYCQLKLVDMNMFKSITHLVIYNPVYDSTYSLNVSNITNELIENLNRAIS